MRDGFERHADVSFLMFYHFAFLLKLSILNPLILSDFVI